MRLRKPFRHRVSLRQLILLLAITSGALMLAVGMLGAYQVQRQQLMDNTLASNEAFARKLAMTTTDMLNRAQRDLAYSANIIQDAEFDPAVMHAELDRLREQGIGFNSVLIAGSNGVIKMATPESLDVRGRQTNSAASRASRRLRAPFVSEPFVSLLGNLAIAISHPLFNDDHSYMGYLMGILYLKTDGGLHRLIGEQYFHDGTFVFVVDTDHRLLYHPEPSRIGGVLRGNSLINTALSGQPGERRFEGPDGEDTLNGYAFVAPANWGIIVQRPTALALRHLNDLMQRVLWLTVAPGLLLLVLLWFSSRWISHPLEQLARIVRGGYEEGMAKQIGSVHGWCYETQQLKHALLASLGSVRTQMGKLQNDAYVDPLTGLGNRRGLAALTQSLQSRQQAFAIVSLDIDLFKSINDTFGHDVGDQVIRSVSEWMRAQARQGDALFRMGGEEFLALLPGIEPARAVDIAERIRASIAEAPILAGRPVTISIGVASWSEGSIEEALKAADQALYRAKQSGRNRVVAAEPADPGRPPEPASPGALL